MSFSPRDERPPLLLIGQPMDARAFAALASHFPDRTVVHVRPARPRRPPGRLARTGPAAAEKARRLAVWQRLCPSFGDGNEGEDMSDLNGKVALVGGAAAASARRSRRRWSTTARRS
jgi:hypothetical protein